MTIDTNPSQIQDLSEQVAADQMAYNAALQKQNEAENLLNAAISKEGNPFLLVIILLVAMLAVLSAQQAVLAAETNWNATNQEIINYMGDCLSPNSASGGMELTGQDVYDAAAAGNLLMESVRAGESNEYGSGYLSSSAVDQIYDDLYGTGSQPGLFTIFSMGSGGYVPLLLPTSAHAPLPSLPASASYWNNEATQLNDLFNNNGMSGSYNPTWENITGDLQDMTAVMTASNNTIATTFSYVGQLVQILEATLNSATEAQVNQEQAMVSNQKS
jgi:hypothetical protein